MLKELCGKKIQMIKLTKDMERSVTKNNVTEQREPFLKTLISVVTHPIKYICLLGLRKSQRRATKFYCSVDTEDSQCFPRQDVSQPYLEFPVTVQNVHRLCLESM